MFSSSKLQVRWKNAAVPKTRRAICEVPDAECPGNLGYTVAEKTFPGRRLASEVVSNRGLKGERIVRTVERGSLTEDTPDGTRL